MTGATIDSFGAIDGIEIKRVTLTTKAGATAKILTWGAVLQDLVVPAANGPQRVVLGLNSIEDYAAHSPYFGAVPGRFANRIGHGRFALDGKTYDLPRNERGVTILHGGPAGFGVRPWTLKHHTETSVTLTLHSPNGDQGFPGALEVTCVYTLIEPATLRYELTATTDAATVVNLTNHAYFNLDGSAQILDHELTLNADARTPVDADLIPTGEILAVAGTAYDFRKARTIRNSTGQTYDDNFVLAVPATTGVLARAATVHSTKSGVTLDVHTDQPGVQFYDASALHCPVPGLGGAHYGKHAGLCLETQLFPDSPNKPQFPSSVLRPGETYSNTTEYRFS